MTIVMRLVFILMFAGAAIGSEGRDIDPRLFPPEWAVNWERATSVYVYRWTSNQNSADNKNIELRMVSALKGTEYKQSFVPKNPLGFHKEGDVRLSFSWEMVDNDGNLVAFKTRIVSVRKKEFFRVQDFVSWVRIKAEHGVNLLPVRPSK